MKMIYCLILKQNRRVASFSLALYVLLICLISFVDAFNSTLSNVNTISCTQPSAINNQTVVFLGNCQNLLYFADLPLGSNQQILTWQIATGISIPWMPLVEGNETNGFNFSGSATVNVTNTTAYIQFGNNSAVGGNYGSDYLSISSSSAIDYNIDILFIFNQTGPGVPQGVQGAISLDYGGQNIFDIAYENKTIVTSVFSLDLNPLGNQSYLYYNNGLPTQISLNTTWIPRYTQALNNWWQLEIVDMEINGIQIIQNAPKTAILNSGASFVNFGSDLFNAVVSQYFNFTYCFIDNGFPVCPCNLSSSWPSFSFKLMGIQVYLQPAQYKKQFSQTGLCSAGIVSGGTSDSSLIVFGLPFFRAYTISFNKLSQKIGFYGTSKPVYIYDLDHPFSAYFIISQYVIGGIAGLLSIAGIIFSILNCRKMRVQQLERYVKKFEQKEKLMEESQSDDKSSEKSKKKPSLIELGQKD